ncbi:RDD family protein [Nocardia sp. BSTN01]|uniref:RDD family protein n=1 Tax=Nocardia sp. BSTN01 TaxID=2783665 RepID=UPI001890592C|nr:RDD family protein [Nocardia sp. BSTN01]MBF4999769.1 RDD family protein [Nocardia sp. BSTN01]
MIVVNFGDSHRGTAVSATVSVVTLAAAVLFCGGILGATMLWIRRRKVRSLKRFPWYSYRIRYLQNGRYEYVQLLGGQGETLSTLLLSTWSTQVGKVVNAQTSEIWFAGDPHRYGVVSSPGGGDICYAYRTQAPAEKIATPSHSAVDAEGKTVRCGSLKDTAFSSPRLLRRVCGFVLDVVVHAAGGAAIALALAPGFSPEALRAGDFQQMGFNPFIALCCFAGPSFVDRVLLQAVVHTTVGKAVFGLVAIQPDTGRYPTFRRLMATWWFHAYLPLALFGDGAGPDRLGNYFMTAVRWRDIR